MVCTILLVIIPLGHIYIGFSHIHMNKSFEIHFRNILVWRPWPLTDDLGLQTCPIYPSNWPPCQNSRVYVCPFGCKCGNTHTDNVITITSVTSHMWGVLIMLHFLDNLSSTMHLLPLWLILGHGSRVSDLHSQTYNQPQGPLFCN